MKKVTLAIVYCLVAVSGIVVTPAPALASCNGPEIDPCPLVNAACNATDPAYKVRDRFVDCQERH